MRRHAATLDATLDARRDVMQALSAPCLAHPALTSPVRRRSAAMQLARVALGAFREGRAAPWSAPSPGPTANRVDGEETRTLRLGHMTAAERSTLLDLAAPREQALALARASRLDEAGAAMRAARFLLSVVRLSDGARAYADTMQQAAESYLSYLHRDHAGAHARMQDAIAATNRLASSWGESDFIVCRRVDLAHNLMRVEMRQGAYDVAMERGAGLLALLAGVPGAAPDAAGVPPLDASTSRILADLVTGTVAELLAPLEAGHAAALLVPFAPFAHPAIHAAPSSRAAVWLGLKAAVASGASVRFLRDAAPFLRAGRGRTPTLWYATALDLARSCSALALHDAPAAELVDEMLSELHTGAGVPARLSAAARDAARDAACDAACDAARPRV